MTPQELKNSILLLAIQGKLVEQRPDEGTAEELYRQIQSEKQKLIKEGKIKKEKTLPEITEEEKPFDIPDSWKWVRLIDLCSLVSDGTHKTPTYVETGIPFVSVKDISGGKMDFSNTRFISEDEHKQLITRCKPEKNDVLICRIGTLGKALKIDTDLEFSIFVSLGLIKIIDPQISQYIVSTINSGYGYSWIQKVKVGGGTHTFKINLDDLRLFPIPLPPIKEQDRIHSKIEELLPLIDRYEKAWSRLEEFNKRFPDDMQKSILQIAIQGKLVEQRPEEGTGEELYQQIQAEKQKLIKEGKIKKEKPLPDITEEEKPFDIPENWKWVRLSNISDKLTDGSHNPPPNTGKGYPVISAKNIKQGYISFDNVDRYTDQAGFDRENPRTNISYGDIIMGIIGGSIGNVGIFTHDTKVIAQRSIAIIHTLIDTEYLAKVLNSPYIQNHMHASASGSAQGGIYLGTLSNFLTPLPPLAEQKRIVAKIEELLPLCNKLK